MVATLRRQGVEVPIGRGSHPFATDQDQSSRFAAQEPAQHRVFIGCTNRVMVVDESDGALLGDVIGIKGAHGTAIAAASGRIRHVGQ